MEQKFANSKHDTPEDSPGFLLWCISTAWRRSLESVLTPLKLTHPQFVILAATGWLTRQGALTSQRAVGDMAGLDPNTTSQILKGLEKKGLIQRDTSPRTKHPSLTKEGATLLNQALPAVEQADATFFDPLTSQEITTMITLFQRLSKGNA